MENISGRNYYRDDLRNTSDAVRQWFSARGDFALQEISGHVWRYF